MLLVGLLCVCCVALLQGKEFETRLKEKKPGDLSDELRIALGMPVGPVSSNDTQSDNRIFVV